MLCANLTLSFGQITPKKKKSNFLQKSLKFINDPVDAMKDEAYQQLSDARSAYDSTNFQYAIDLVDNSALFRNKEIGAKFRDGLLDVGRDSGDKTPLEQAQSMINTGEFFYASDSYRLALVYFFAAQYYLEDEGLTDVLEYPKVLADLGMLYHTMGRYSLAEEYTNEALEIRKSLFGDESPAYAASLNNLAVLTKDQGEYNVAEERVEQAVSIAKNTNGEESLEYAFILNNKAMLNYAVGRYETAEGLLKESLEIAGTAMKEKQGNYQRLMTNLAVVYTDMGEYEKAEEIYKNAIDIHNKRLSFGKKTDPDYAHMLNNLAALYVTMGRNDEVEDLLKESISIYEKKFGEDHPTYAGAVSDLSRFKLVQGSWDEAMDLNSEALRIRGRTLGDHHPKTIESLEDKAILLWKTGKLKEAEDTYSEVMQSTLGFVDKFFAPMSEAEKTKFWNQLYPRLQRYYSFAIDRSAEQPEIMSNVLDYHLATKAMLMSETTRIRNQILAGEDEDLKKDFMTWIDQKEQLAYYYGLSKEEQRDEKIDLDSLEEASNTLERSLSTRSSLFGKGFDVSSYSSEDLSESLDPNEALVDIIRVDRKIYSGEENVAYLALIVKNGQSVPDHVLISNGNELETKYFSYYRNVIKQQMQDDYSYKQYWKSIDEKIKGVGKVYVSLDGIYNQVSIPSLHDGSNFLVDKVRITLITSSRDLLENEDAKAPDNKEFLLLGDPEFGAAEVIAPLPGTRKEVESLGNILKSKGYKYTIKTGASASESLLKSEMEVSTLHVATHGYFLKDPGNTGKVFGVSADHASDNPLLRSGLMFSNAAQTLKGQSFVSLENNDNGLLTAYEAMNLQLNGLQTVVLSACETGLGDVKAGEGVYGLQRAFMVAGAESLLMSLWTVNDTSTQELMTLFYQNWTSGQSQEEALYNAQLALKEKYPHPYYWGAFVMVSR